METELRGGRTLEYNKKDSARQAISVSPLSLSLSLSLSTYLSLTSKLISPPILLKLPPQMLHRHRIVRRVQYNGHAGLGGVELEAAGGEGFYAEGDCGVGYWTARGG